MTTLYKLTNQRHQSFGGCQWGENATHRTDGRGQLCGPGWLHAYTHPLLAVLLNPMHAAIDAPVLWEAEGEVGKTDHGLKVGTRQLTTLRVLSLPVVTSIQRVRFGLLCALHVYRDEEWRAWAQRWLDGTDRSKTAARAARTVAETARIAMLGATEAALAPQAAAQAAAQAAEWAARAAEWAAQAAEWAARADSSFDPIAFATQAVEVAL